MMFLSGENLLFIGGNKNVYQHPSDLNKCVKISIKKPDLDIQLELEFRETCIERAENSKLIPQYFGEIETNLGTGYMFELIRDFDGSISRPLDQILKTDYDPREILKLLEEFENQCLEECLVLRDREPWNLLVQRIDESQKRIRVIDGMGTTAKIPLPYFSKKITRLRERKHWREFMEKLQIDADSR